MTDVNLDVLQDKFDRVSQENIALKKQLENNAQGVQGLLAQLDAHKQMMNDSLNQGLALRTQLILLQNQNKQLNEHNTSLRQQLAEKGIKDAFNKVS
jgi:hypothetical protein